MSRLFVSNWCLYKEYSSLNYQYGQQVTKILLDWERGIPTNQVIISVSSVTLDPRGQTRTLQASAVDWVPRIHEFWHHQRWTRKLRYIISLLTLLYTVLLVQKLKEMKSVIYNPVGGLITANFSQAKKESNNNTVVQYSNRYMFWKFCRGL